MVKLWRHIILLLFALLFLGKTNVCAQNIDAFARISVTPREGVVRQPYKVTITVHSSTWFAKPLQFANLQIDNAFIIPFTRTVSSINYINRKKYATLSFYYLVFPYNTGNIEIPELVLSTSIPPEGTSKGEPVILKTKPQIIKVKPIPSSKDEKVWMVADNISIKESWSKPLDDLKVGDVVEREITITATGTLPSLIQPIEITKPEFASIYPKEPELKDTRTNQGANGVRVESYSYLFEEAAELTLPAEEIVWWNPKTKRVYKRTIPEKNLAISVNPDLAMMESLKDSLVAMSAPIEVAGEEETIPWLRIGFWVVVLFIVSYFGTLLIRHLVTSNRKRRAAYLQSEAYYFKQAAYALQHKSLKEFIRALYVWFDKARHPKQNAAIYYYLNKEERALFESVIRNSKSELNAGQKNKLIHLLNKLKSDLSSRIPSNEIGQLNRV